MAKKTTTRTKSKAKTRPNKKMGRPTKFNELIQAKILDLAEQGATDEQIANATGVGVRTIGYWKSRHVDFLHALKNNKVVADELVEASLFQRAIGYSHPAEKQFLTKDEFNRTVIMTHEYIEHYPPDTIAAIFWLKNRQPERWREKPIDKEVGELSEKAEVILEWDDSEV